MRRVGEAKANPAGNPEENGMRLKENTKIPNSSLHSTCLLSLCGNCFSSGFFWLDVVRDTLQTHQAAKDHEMKLPPGAEMHKGAQDTLHPHMLFCHAGGNG